MADIIQSARIERGAAFPNAARCRACASPFAVKLSANPVVFVFNVERSVERSENFIFSFSWSRQHEFDRPEHGESEFVKFTALRVDSGIADVAKDHIGAPNLIGRTLEGFGKSFLDRVFLQTDAQIASDDLDHILGLFRSKPSKQIQ